MEFIFGVLLPLVLLVVCGILIGGWNEWRHLRDLDQRQQQFSHILVNNLKRITDPHSVVRCTMVSGSVVIASDYFKTFATGLRNLVGGEAKSAQRLLIRARREALMRLLEEADRFGAAEVWNVRFGTSNIGAMGGNQGIMQVEMYAWATAVVRDATAVIRGEHKCPHCGYNLRGARAGAACPECGAPVVSP